MTPRMLIGFEVGVMPAFRQLGGPVGVVFELGHHLPHFLALRANVAFFFMAGDALGSLSTAEALACTLIPGLLAAAVNSAPSSRARS